MASARVLKVGCSGSDVRALQTLLQSERGKVQADGIYGAVTEQAVRTAQRRHRLYPPDGIAGPRTLAVLQHDQHAHKQKTPAKRLPSAASFAAPVSSPQRLGNNQYGPLAPVVVPALNEAARKPKEAGLAQPPSSMSTSPQGLQLIYQHEAQKGVSNHVYWPKGASGVTLGAGYDMKARKASDVEADLTAIGISAEKAKIVGQAAGLQGQAAERFASSHRDVIDLTPDQETALLLTIIPHYQGMVQRAVHVPLHQYEFDALVSYAYNPGGGWHAVTLLVNSRKVHDAMVELSHHVTSKHKIVESLVIRRAAEIKLFLYGQYT